MSDEAVKRVEEAIASDSLSTDLMDRLGAATKQLEEATEVYKRDSSEIAAKARDEAALALTAAKAEVDAQNAANDAERDAEIDKLLAEAKGTRAPSKAWLVAGGASGTNSTFAPGTFLYDIWARKSNEFAITDRMKAEDELRDMGFSFTAPPGASKGTIGSTEGGWSDGGFPIPQTVIEMTAATILKNSPHMASEDLKAKATLGLTAATGSGLIPGATVSDIVKVGRYRSAVTQLVDSNVVDAYQTSIPVRVTAPTKAVVVAWGDTKTNADLAYGGYTATMYTLAIIYDLAKQWIKFSRGAAEADVMSELAHAFELGRAYYILQGSGSSEPYGIQTAIGNAFSAFTTSFSPSATTLAGSIAKAVATAAGDLAVRNRTPEAAVLGPAAYWNMVSQGTDTAGFFFAQANGPQAIRPGTLVSPFGIPVYPESQLAGSDDLLVGEWSALDVFYGDSYRVDTSDEAGDRWDKNLVGFRAEQEMGLDARAAVFAGAFQFVADIIP